MKRLAPSEHETQCAIVQWLRVSGYAPVKITNEGKRSIALANYYRREGMHKGASDIVVPLDGGRSLWIECKSPVGTLGEAQKAFRVLLEARGHDYLIARSLDDVTRWFEVRQ